MSKNEPNSSGELESRLLDTIDSNNVADDTITKELGKNTISLSYSFLLLLSLLWSFLLLILLLLLLSLTPLLLTL